MNKKNRIYIIITGVVAITLIWLSQSNKNLRPELESLSGANSINNTVDKPVDTVEGTLWRSDDDAKGNLMLVTSDAIIYIRTSRDFNELVSKNVVVSIDGTSDNFTLLNIEKNLAKDGFIQTN
ncbi:MAG: hypothetical protein A2651_00045 [Candidatus Yanofskybacteria bacterium RIFCSPHIGHO2_01_FULL_42_12]|uniref:Uncharacterized protein n=1 Tax=Candidatus Yanofskybacteria bacterium RIFCSPLOWO2_01_FULL_42_49 TaxID=1802694 RepID=A0A1F8GCJ1_9BACT|nr:MAG: hypothetical protein A2651_00045 [Candidatus Yanofskybacteria bacterium RIFCSPHIGHO2_01_FULL_42_12]OGN23001.1 MAG: hypothetical protein A2918_02615 [Candidatus Yanofskybacteria bacterium RIFCSPLOWO2_01_FULL_42_49]